MCGCLREHNERSVLLLQKFNVYHPRGVNRLEKWEHIGDENLLDLLRGKKVYEKGGKGCKRVKMLCASLADDTAFVGMSGCLMRE